MVEAGVLHEVVQYKGLIQDHAVGETVTPIKSDEREEALKQLGLILGSVPKELEDDVFWECETDMFLEPVGLPEGCLKPLPKVDLDEFSKEAEENV